MRDEENPEVLQSGSKNWELWKSEYVSLQWLPLVIIVMNFFGVYLGYMVIICIVVSCDQPNGSCKNYFL